MGGIFICYRRSDTDYIAGRLHRELADHFGARQVFRDINTIKVGSDFGQRIGTFIGACDALVAVIGDDWLRTDESGKRRIDAPKDWVRQEIASALERGILVVPVMVEGATVPREAELPPSLRKLAKRNALDLTDARWDYDVTKLIEALEEVVAPDAAVLRPLATRGADRREFPSTPTTPSAPVPAPPLQPPPAFTPPAQPPYAFRSAPTVTTVDDGAGGSSVPQWARIAVPVVLVALVAAVVISVIARSGGHPGDAQASNSTSIGNVPSSSTPAPSIATSIAPLPTLTAVRTITGPWTGRNGALTLAVEKVEVGTNIRLFLLVRNGLKEPVTLPTYGYFQAVDNTGHNYQVESAEWATTFAPGDVRGTIVLSARPQPGASTMKVGFSTIFGTLAIDGGIYANGVRLT